MDAKKSIELLNKGVADELQAVHQYMYWHFHLDDQGFAPTGRDVQADRHSGNGPCRTARRAHPVSERRRGNGGRRAGGEDHRSPKDSGQGGRRWNRTGVASYNQFALKCSQNADAASKQVFEALVNDEEAHFDEFDKQLENIKRFGPKLPRPSVVQQGPAGSIGNRRIAGSRIALYADNRLVILLGLGNIVQAWL